MSLPALRAPARRSNYLDAVGRDENIDLPKGFLKTLFEILEELLGGPIVGGHDFDLDDVVDVLDTAVLPGSLIRRGPGTHGDGAKHANEFFLDSLDLLRLNFLAVVVF